jgi:hypothetical protein
VQTCITLPSLVLCLVQQLKEGMAYVNRLVQNEHDAQMFNEVSSGCDAE